MGPTRAPDQVDEFADELLRTGCMIFGVAADLVEELPGEAYPGEEPGAVIISMMTGTIRTALVDIDPDDVSRATELIAEARNRVIEHLQLAVELSRRMGANASDCPDRPDDNCRS